MTLKRVVSIILAVVIVSLILAGVLPEHWAKFFRFTFGILVACGALFLALVHFSISWQAEKKKLEELLEQIEAAKSQQEESPPAPTHTSGNGEDGEALESVYRLDAVTGEMREIKPGRYVPGPVELEIQTDE